VLQIVGYIGNPEKPDAVKIRYKLVQRADGPSIPVKGKQLKVVTLKYASPGEMKHLLYPIMPVTVTVTPDARTGQLLLGGPDDAVAETVREIEQLDVPGKSSSSLAPKSR